MRIITAQINSTIGDFEKNVEIIFNSINESKKESPDLIVFPELSLCGYPPMDLLNQPSFLESNLISLNKILQHMPPKIAVAIGHIDKNHTRKGKRLTNTVSVLKDGKVLHKQAKTLLPAYDVFDEPRYFEPATSWNCLKLKGEQIGFPICEDIWWSNNIEDNCNYDINPVQEFVKNGASILISPSASPYYSGKPQLRRKNLVNISKTIKIPIVYVNMIGANDSIIFDGQSFISSAEGLVLQTCKPFQEDLLLWDNKQIISSPINSFSDSLSELQNALVLGIKDYLIKTSNDRAHVAVSGGIDSAVVLTLASQAMGAENITAFSLPSMFSSRGSKEDAIKLCNNLGVELHQIIISDLYSKFNSSLSNLFNGLPPDTTEENLQARIRAVLMMAFSNKTKSVLLATGNKSELATGYSTLYGDLSGALLPIGDLFKTQVYELANHINKDAMIIPMETIKKPPSAELKFDQKDEDTLPPYEQLDKILQLHLINNLTTKEIVEEGFDLRIVEDILNRVGITEHKRFQAPPVLKISPKSFGIGRRFPIAKKNS